MYDRTRIKIDKNEQILDLFKLQKEGEDHNKSWILARGKNLKIEINCILDDLCEGYTNNELINDLASRLNINIKIDKNFNSLSLESGIKKARKNLKLSKYYFQKHTKTSGSDWEKIESGTLIPSCRKLRKIFKIVKINGLRFNCKIDNYCLEKFILICRCINKKDVFALPILNEILLLWKNSLNVSENKFIKKKNDVLKTIDTLRIDRYHAKETHVECVLNEDLSKIVGAFCADGNLSIENNIRWEEEHYSNMEVLSKWIMNYFNKTVKIERSKRERNSWTIGFKDSIISRFLEVFFDFKPWIKKYNVRAPKIIRNSDFNIKKAFVVGAMTFEAGANSDGSISLGVCSKNFRDDISKILEEDNLKINKYNIKKREGKSPLYSLSTNDNCNIDQRKKFKNYFEKNTIKWLKMKDFEEGFSNKVKNQERAIKGLKLFFYKSRLVNIEEIIIKCKYLNNFDVYDLVKETKYPRGTLTKYLSFLCKTNIIIKTRQKRSEYSFNDNITKWRIPSLKFHHTLKI